MRDIRAYLRETGSVKFLTLARLGMAISVIWLLLRGGEPAAFFAGCVTVLFPATILYCIVVYGEFGARLAGVSAERETYKLLRKHVGRELWHVVPHVRFSKGVDVDMVALTPRAVLAMEVKWHGRFRPEDKIRSSANQAAYRARRLERTLRDLGMAADLPVLPVLAVWGPASYLVERGVRRFDKVTVVDAHRPEMWLPLVGTGRVTADTADGVLALLEQHAALVAAS